MGNQILTSALASPELAKLASAVSGGDREVQQTQFKNCFAFAAPDVDKEDFLERLDRIKELGLCCLYAACNDWPLLLSCVIRGFHGRAGAVGAISGMPLTGDTFTTIDCTGRRSGDTLGHSYPMEVRRHLPSQVLRAQIMNSRWEVLYPELGSRSPAGVTISHANNSPGNTPHKAWT